MLATFFMACNGGVLPSTQTLGEVLGVLRGTSGAGAAVLVQAAECMAREADLRLIREVLAPASVGLLNSEGRQPDIELRVLVRDVFQLPDSALIRMPGTVARLLKDVGVTSTPVLVVWNDAASAVLVTSVSANRKVLRGQLIAAQTLTRLRE